MNARQRRKRASIREQEQFVREAYATRNALVRANMATKPERNYYAGIQSSLALCEQAGARSGGMSPTFSVRGKIVRGKLVRN